MNIKNQEIIFDSILAKIIEEACNYIDTPDEVIAINIDDISQNIKINKKKELCEYLSSFYGINDVSINKKGILLVMAGYPSLKEISIIYNNSYKLWEEKFCHEPFKLIWKQYAEFYNTISYLVQKIVLKQLREDIPYFINIPDNAIVTLYHQVLMKNPSSILTIYDELYDMACIAKRFLEIFLQDNDMRIYRKDGGDC